MDANRRGWTWASELVHDRLVSADSASATGEHFGSGMNCHELGLAASAASDDSDATGMAFGLAGRHSVFYSRQLRSNPQSAGNDSAAMDRR